MVVSARGSGGSGVVDWNRVKMFYIFFGVVDDKRVYYCQNSSSRTLLNFKK